MAEKVFAVKQWQAETEYIGTVVNVYYTKESAQKAAETLNQEYGSHDCIALAEEAMENGGYFHFYTVEEFTVLL